MVFYLKYRPQTLTDLVGQSAVAETLQKALLNNRLAHAYLFCGPRGVGKTSTARILAKMVNCLSESKPCNKCSSCSSISDGSNLDFIEIDAASNRGIDDVRELRDKIKLSASNLVKKVYIIDEVHMLTTEAFNALLKTLEEPPAHVLFILATTEIHKVPATILSRVQRLDFKPASLEDLTTALKKVIQAEKLEVSEEALLAIAKKSDGSFRDGIKLLDQLASQNSKIGLELVNSSFGLNQTDGNFELIANILAHDGQKSLDLVEQVCQSGVDTKELLTQLLETLRAVLLVKHGAVATVKRSYSSEHLTALTSLAEKVEVGELVRILKIFEEASARRKFATIAKLPLELAVVEATQTQLTNSGKEQVLPAHRPIVNLAPPEPTYDEVPSQPDSLPGSDLFVLQDKWNYVLETIHPYNFSLEALLRVVKVGSCQDSQLILKVPYSFHQRILETPRNRDMVESVVSDILGKKITVLCELDTSATKFDDLANIDVAADDEVIKIAAEIFNS